MVNSSELEVEYRIDVACRDGDEGRLRVLVLGVAGSESLRVRHVRRERVPESDQIRLDFVFKTAGIRRPSSSWPRGSAASPG